MIACMANSFMNSCLKCVEREGCVKAKNTCTGFTAKENV